VLPYAVAYVDGAWYLVGWCTRVDDTRTFRVDRILDAEQAEGSFAVPENFVLSDYLTEGRAFRPIEEPVEVTVRYGAAVARWVAEREPGAEMAPGGSITVRHMVSDPGWLVRHVLRFGPDAEVLKPADMREMVRRAVRQLSSA